MTFHHRGLRFAQSRRLLSVLFVYLTLPAFQAAPLLAQHKVVINEIMFAPTTPEPEWVELYNSDSQSQTLENIYLHDGSGRAAIPKCTIAAKSYVILCKDTSALLKVRHLSSAVQLLRMTLPSLSNSGESLYLQSKDSAVYDSLSYRDSLIAPGHSVERIDAAQSVRAFANLQSCRYIEGASCGEANSVSRLQRDIGIESLAIDSTDLTLRLRCRNLSFDHIHSIRVSMWIGGLVLSDTSIEVLEIDSSIERSLSLDSIQRMLNYNGRALLHASVSLDNDQRRRNDTASIELVLNPPPLSLRINEFMYDPSESSAEFVELYNTLPDSLDLYGFSLCDGAGGVVRCTTHHWVGPADYVVLSKDTAFMLHYPTTLRPDRIVLCQGSFSMRSSGDDIQLLNCYGAVVDSLHFLPSWHSKAAAQTKGRSLEKVAPRLSSSEAWSWTSCTDSSSATPGEVNSVARTVADAAEISASPNPFSPRSVLGWRQSSLIRLRLPFVQCVLLARIFDTQGRQVHELMNGTFSGSDCSLAWDGRNAEGYMLPMGAYILQILAQDQQSAASFAQNIVLIIGQ